MTQSRLSQLTSHFTLVGSERKELPRVANSLALIAGRFASSGLGFLTWLVAARLYTAAEVGLASGLVSAMMLLLQFAMLGIGAAYIVRYPAHQARPTRLLNTASTIVSAAALIICGIFIVLSALFFEELNIVALQPLYGLIFTGMVLFSTVNTLMDSISIALRRNDHVLARNVLFGLIAILVIGLLALLMPGRTSLFIILGWTAAGLSACVLGSIQLWRTLSGYLFFPSLEKGIASELIRSGLPNYLLTLSERAPNWVLPILVTELLSPSDNARWYAVWMMAWVAFQIPISIGQNLFADITRQPDNMDSAIAYSRRSSLILGTLAAAGILLLAPFMLNLLGKEYAAIGALPLRILSLAVYPVVFIQAYYAVCRGTGRLREATLTGLTSGVVSTVSAAVVGLQYGIAGMAVAWLVTQIFAGIWAYWRTRKLTMILRENQPAG
jgi:O-antigen/teichoic acid export membrane protein